MFFFLFNHLGDPVYTGVFVRSYVTECSTKFELLFNNIIIMTD